MCALQGGFSALVLLLAVAAAAVSLVPRCSAVKGLSNDEEVLLTDKGKEWAGKSCGKQRIMHKAGEYVKVLRIWSTKEHLSYLAYGWQVNGIEVEFSDGSKEWAGGCARNGVEREEFWLPTDKPIDGFFYVWEDHKYVSLLGLEKHEGGWDHRLDDYPVKYVFPLKRRFVKGLAVICTDDQCFIRGVAVIVEKQLMKVKEVKCELEEADEGAGAPWSVHELLLENHTSQPMTVSYNYFDIGTSMKTAADSFSWAAKLSVGLHKEKGYCDKLNAQAKYAYSSATSKEEKTVKSESVGSSTTVDVRPREKTSLRIVRWQPLMLHRFCATVRCCYKDGASVDHDVRGVCIGGSAGNDITETTSEPLDGGGDGGGGGGGWLKRLLWSGGGVGGSGEWQWKAPEVLAPGEHAPPALQVGGDGLFRDEELARSDEDGATLVGGGGKGGGGRKRTVLHHEAGLRVRRLLVYSENVGSWHSSDWVIRGVCVQWSDEAAKQCAGKCSGASLTLTTISFDKHRAFDGYIVAAPTEDRKRVGYISTAQLEMCNSHWHLSNGAFGVGELPDGVRYAWPCTHSQEAGSWGGDRVRYYFPMEGRELRGLVVTGTGADDVCSIEVIVSKKVVRSDVHSFVLRKKTDEFVAPDLRPIIRRSANTGFTLLQEQLSWVDETRRTQSTTVTTTHEGAVELLIIKTGLFGFDASFKKQYVEGEQSSATKLDKIAVDVRTAPGKKVEAAFSKKDRDVAMRFQAKNLLTFADGEKAIREVSGECQWLTPTKTITCVAKEQPL